MYLVIFLKFLTKRLVLFAEKTSDDAKKYWCFSFQLCNHIYELL